MDVDFDELFFLIRVVIGCFYEQSRVAEMTLQVGRSRVGMSEMLLKCAVDVAHTVAQQVLESNVVGGLGVENLLPKGDGQFARVQGVRYVSNDAGKVAKVAARVRALRRLSPRIDGEVDLFAHDEINTRRQNCVADCPAKTRHGKDIRRSVHAGN